MQNIYFNLPKEWKVEFPHTTKLQGLLMETFNEEELARLAIIILRNQLQSRESMIKDTDEYCELSHLVEEILNIRQLLNSNPDVDIDYIDKISDFFNPN